MEAGPFFVNLLISRAYLLIFAVQTRRDASLFRLPYCDLGRRSNLRGDEMQQRFLERCV